MELYVEELPLENVVATNLTPTPMPISTQETLNPFVPSASCTFSQPPTNQVPIHSMVNVGENYEMGAWDYGNESNEFIDDPSKDDVDVDEDALINDDATSLVRIIDLSCWPKSWRTYYTGLHVVVPLHHSPMDDTTWHHRSSTLRTCCAYDDPICKSSFAFI